MCPSSAARGLSGLSGQRTNPRANHSRELDGGRDPPGGPHRGPPSDPPHEPPTSLPSSFSGRLPVSLPGAPSGGLHPVVRPVVPMSALSCPAITPAPSTIRLSEAIPLTEAAAA
jgi:hypothetical protein